MTTTKMKNSVSSLQEIINNKADKRLEADIQNISSILHTFKNYTLLDKINVTINKNGNDKKIKISSFFTSDGLYRYIFDENRDRYREEETKTFMKEIELLKSQVDTLLDINNQ